MHRRTRIILVAGLGLAVALAGATAASAMLQPGGEAAELRASAAAGEQADGYMGVVGSASGDIRAKVEAVNIRRRAYYTDLASKRGAKIEEVAATTACELFRTKVEPGQYYRLADGVWRKRDSTPVPLPHYCG
ncbi:MAG: YdbL family protein [Alphaproteobacteria bacterium]|nr:YdbL family protein [Alphaproteobacteria bacterium]